MYSSHRVVLCLNTLFPRVEPQGAAGLSRGKRERKGPRNSDRTGDGNFVGAEREPWVVVLCVLATQRKHPRCTARALQLAACYFYFAS